MKKIFGSKKGIISAVAASALLILPFAASEYSSRRVDSIQSLNGGTSTCFTRVGQTFTALMIGDFSSGYLAKEFTSTTGECFSQVNKSFDEIFAGSFAQAKKPLNKLTSDLFWFHEKTEKLAKLAQNDETQLSADSTIAGKYSSLESLSQSFQEKLAQKSEQLKTWKNVWTLLSLAGAIGICFLALISGRRRQGELDAFEALNTEAQALLEDSSDLDKMVLKTGRLMEHLFAKINAPSFAELYQKVQTDLLERKADFARESLGTLGAYEEAPEKNAERTDDVSTKTVQELEAQGEVVDFGTTARALVDRMNEKIFSHGILLEQNIDEDFHVKGNSESLEQLLYNLLSFAVEKSVLHDSSRKISLKSKPLGGITYFKTRISNYMLNPSEMELFNGADLSKGSSESANVNLSLMAEIARDMGVAVAAKNIINGGANFTGAEIEVVFTRFKAASSIASSKSNDSENAASNNKVASIMKGSKKDILRALSSNA